MVLRSAYLAGHLKSNKERDILEFHNDGG
ncbi:protein of unknown function [Mesotoga infera]|uniref:Uncharacterized protein n=1 Tax=Mesotoga infera TaxID=1236046 RepID=A0A7Z7LDZ9_9BACT|nr:protein of unknown function [Mesotoga infera]